MDQHTFAPYEQCRTVDVPPFSKRGARGDFILSPNPSNRNIFMNSALKYPVLFPLVGEKGVNQEKHVV
jgi:hypothetical protein